MKKFKTLLHNSAYLSLIIGNANSITEVVNSYVMRRITSYVSMKVACAPNE